MTHPPQLDPENPFDRQLIEAFKAVEEAMGYIAVHPKVSRRNRRHVNVASVRIRAIRLGMTEVMVEPTEEEEE